MPDFINKSIILDEDFGLEFNLTNLQFIETSLDPTKPIVDILDSEARLQLDDFGLRLGFDYAFIMDPPILADIGSGEIGINGLGIETLLSTSLSSNQSVFTTTFSEILMSITEPKQLLNFTGANDLSTVITNLVDTFTAIVRNRL